MGLVKMEAPRIDVATIAPDVIASLLPADEPCVEISRRDPDTGEVLEKRVVALRSLWRGLGGCDEMIRALKNVVDAYNDYLAGFAIGEEPHPEDTELGVAVKQAEVVIAGAKSRRAS